MKENSDNNNPPGIKGLVVFKDLKSKEKQQQEPVSLESIDQKDKIKLIAKFVPFGANYLYALLIANQSIAPITEVKIRIRIPDFLAICRINPSTIKVDTDLPEENEKQIRIEFKKIDEGSQKQINTYLTPLSLEEKGVIKSFVTFINNADFVRALDSEPINLNFQPLSIEKKILPSSEVRQFLEVPNIKKAIKSIGIATEKEVDINYLFNQLLQTIEDQNFQLIIKDEEKLQAWFYGTELVTGDDLLILGEITSNKIEWTAASLNPHIIISILITFRVEFSNRVIIDGIIDTLDQIIELECEHCGSVLPYFPRKGENVECSNCPYEKVIW